MPRPVPLRADLNWLKKTSKERLDTLRASNPSARLSESQLAVAREYGFPSWRKLKAHVERVRDGLDAIVPPGLLRRKQEVSPDDPDLMRLCALIADGEAQPVADLLARKPALANARGMDGQTPLHLAAQYNDVRIAAVLVAYGAKVNATFGESGHTPLSWAVTCNAPDCALGLVKLGAEADLFCAAGIGLLDRVQALFGPDGGLIRGAARTGSSRRSPDGSRLPCPPLTEREQVSDALYIACRNGQDAVVRFLMGKNPDLAFRAFMGGTPLHWAYFGGSRAVIELLEGAGANRDARDDVIRCTPRAFGICTAATWGFAFIVKRLLAGDPSLANPNDVQTSPLHEAVRGKHIQVVRLLLEHEADPTYRDSEGKIPLNLAEDSGSSELVALLSSC
jgi:ankyrin repeat protein